MQVSVRALKNHLSEYLQQVKAGTSLVVTSHHIPIAKIQAIPTTKVRGMQALMCIEGIHWNGKKPTISKNRPKISGTTAADYVLEDRG
jgi:prevent-host-death family protein